MVDDAIKSRDAIIGDLRAKVEKLDRKLRESCGETQKGNEVIEELKKDVGRASAADEEERQHQAEERHPAATRGTDQRPEQQA